jgi:hypothetical protein
MPSLYLALERWREARRAKEASMAEARRAAPASLVTLTAESLGAD